MNLSPSEKKQTLFQSSYNVKTCAVCSVFKSLTIESCGVDSRGRHYVPGVFEEFVHLVESDVAVDDDQVVAAVLNKDNGASKTFISLTHEQII